MVVRVGMLMAWGGVEGGNEGDDGGGDGDEGGIGVRLGSLR